MARQRRAPSPADLCGNVIAGAASRVIEEGRGGGVTRNFRGASDNSRRDRERTLARDETRALIASPAHYDNERLAATRIQPGISMGCARTRRGT